MGERLSRILFPFELTSFLRHYEQREHFLVSRDSPDYYHDLLNANDLDTLLQSENLPAAFLEVVKEGHKYALEEWSRIDLSVQGEQRLAVPERLFELYARGATLILRLADRTIPSLGNLCRSLTCELGFPAHANVYITPRGAAGFARHADGHEVFVLQIAGSKRWQLYPGASTTEIALHSGDLLYIPQGLAHAARAEDVDSIHITLGLRPIYAFQLIEELSALAKADTAFRRPAPPLFAGEGARQSFEETFRKDFAELSRRAKASELLERRTHAIAVNQSQGWPGRLSDLRVVADITPTTVVCRRKGILTALDRGAKLLTVTFGGKQIRVPLFLEAAVGRILADHPFAIGELEGLLGDAEKVRLVAEFVKAGLLKIVSL